MTLSAINSSYLQGIYGSLTPIANKNATDPLLSPTTSSSSTASTPTSTSASSAPVINSTAATASPWLPDIVNPRIQSALDQLQQTDPSLAQTVQGFQSQLKNLASSGASQSTIAATIKNDISSLTTQQQSELKQAMSAGKGHHVHRHGGGASEAGSLLSALTTTSTTTDSSASAAGVGDANWVTGSIFGQTTQDQSLASFLQSQMATGDSSLFAIAA